MDKAVGAFREDRESDSDDCFAVADGPARTESRSFHPDADLLELAATSVAHAVAALAKPGSIPPFIADQVRRQMALLQEAARKLDDVEHDIVFVGPVGCGKSTVLSALAGLVLSDADLAAGGGSRLERRSMLASSAGRTSVCPVRIEPGEAVAITLEPLAHAEVEALAREYLYEIWTVAQGGAAVDTGSLIPEETARALRNMASTSRRALSALRRTTSSETEFADRFVAMMRLEARTAIRFEPPADAEPGWLRTMLADINSGRHEHVSLPRLVRLTVPAPAIASGLRISLVDSKGTEGTGVRRDVREAMADERTLVVACSSFASCPDEAAQGLVEYARDVAGTVRSGRLCVLGLAKNGEAASVRDEFGDPVETAEEGHRVRREQAARVLGSLAPDAGLAALSFDAGEDPADMLRAQLGTLVSRIRSEMGQDVRSLASGLRELTDNAGSDFLRDLAPVLEAADRVVEEHILFDGVLPGSDELSPLSGAAARHASKVWASTRRSGDYEFLNVHDAIADVFAKTVLARAGRFQRRLDEALQAFARPEYPAVSAVVRRLSAQGARIPQNVSAAVHKAIADLSMTTLGKDGDLWTRCSGLWGHPERRDGPYVAYVAEAVGAALARDGTFDVGSRAAVSEAWNRALYEPMRRACAADDIIGPRSAIRPRPLPALGTGHPSAEPDATGSTGHDAGHLSDASSMGEFFDALLDDETEASLGSSLEPPRHVGFDALRARFIEGLDRAEPSQPSGLGQDGVPPRMGRTGDAGAWPEPVALVRPPAPAPAPVHPELAASVKAFVNFMDRPRLVLSEPQLETLLDLLRGIEAEPPASPERVWIETSTDRMELHWSPAQPFAFWVAGAMLSDGRLVGGWAEWWMAPGGPVLMQRRGINGFLDQVLSTDVVGELVRAAASIPRSFLDRRVMELADRLVEQTKTESIPAFPAVELEPKRGLRERVPFMGKSFSAEFKCMNSGVVYKQHLHIEHDGNPVVLEVQGSWSKHTNGIKVTLGPSKSQARGSKHGGMIRKALDAAQAGIGRAVTDFLRSRSEFGLSVRANAEMRAAFYECQRHRVAHAGLLAARARVGEFEAELERIRTGFEYPCPS
jgi:energy-coupling factor transporter ATP-binding protein EcfA2